VVGSGFFGREREIARILKQPDTNFAIIGARRIGKTSLLKEVHRRLLDQGERPDRVVRVLDCSIFSSSDQFVQTVMSELSIREIARLQPWEYVGKFLEFMRLMSKMRDGRITIFLDEFDKLLALSSSMQDPLPKLLRASMEADHCRYIVAGFQAMNNELSKYDSPLYKAFESQPLGPFDKRETEELVLRPMRSLRVHFEDEREVVGQIHVDTGGHPRLVQHYCQELVKILEREHRRTISPTLIVEIYNSGSFKEEVFNTFRDSMSIQDQVLVYALLVSFPENKEAFTQEEMYEVLERQGCRYSAEQVDRSCDNLVQAGVFVREGSRHQFAIPVFLHFLRANYKLDYLLSAAKKELGL
jgi:Cdc6-like AAA superfamily ATPase